MKVRLIPMALPKRPASKTTLSRGDAWPGSGEPEAGALPLVQSSCANTNAAKSTSRERSISRCNVVVPGLNEVVQGSTCATVSSPRVSALRSFSCFPEEPRKMRGLSVPSATRRLPGHCGGLRRGHYPLMGLLRVGDHRAVSARDLDRVGAHPLCELPLGIGWNHLVVLGDEIPRGQ